ncbi:MAG TPA: hypothetical protein VKH37_05170, partial [Ferruginibacter sp.]|nr:hypothetical protein [Ferruginibacter sp.]
NYLWPVGFSTNYTPVTYNFTNLTPGDLNVIAITGDQPNLATSSIDATKSVNMYWTTTASNSAASTSYDGNYAWPSGLNDGGVTASAFKYGKYSGSSWSYATVNGTPTTTTLAFTGASGFSDHAIGNCKTISTSNPGSNQSICGTSYTLSANAVASYESGAWTISSGPSTNLSQFSSTTSPTATFTPAGGPGTYVLTWTISIASCGTSSANNVTLIFGTTPTANASTAISSCNGTTAFAMTGATAAGSFSAATWSGGTGTWNQNIDPALATYTPASDNESFTATLTVTGSGGCTGTNPTSTRAINIGNSGSWMGTADNDWNNPSNWCSGVPTSTTDVTILPGRPNAPAIGATGGVCRNLTISSGASLAISGSTALDVYGNLTNNGTFTANSSTVTFKGSAQSISGSSTTAFSTLTIENGSTVTGTVASSAATANINSGGKYIQQAGTSIIGTTKNFVSGSSYELQTAITFSSATAFGNFTVNFTGATGVQANGFITSVLNDLEIKNTGTAAFRLVGGASPTIAIGGNLIVDGGALEASSGGGSPTINVAGGLQMSSGSLKLATSTGTPTLNISGDVSLSGGTFQPNTAGGTPVVSVYGNWINSSSTYTPGNETVTFLNGGAANNINGPTTTTFNNVILNNSLGLALNSSPTVSGTLTLTSGSFNVGNNTLTLNGPAIS